MLVYNSYVDLIHFHVVFLSFITLLQLMLIVQLFLYSTCGKNNKCIKYIVISVLNNLITY